MKRPPSLKKSYPFRELPSKRPAFLMLTIYALWHLMSSGKSFTASWNSFNVILMLYDLSLPMILI